MSELLYYEDASVGLLFATDAHRGDRNAYRAVHRIPKTSSACLRITEPEPLQQLVFAWVIPFTAGLRCSRSV